MGLIQIVQKALGYRLGTPNSNGLGLQFTEMQVPPGWNYQSYLQKYGEIGWLFACVNVIAAAVAKTQWHLYEVDKAGDRDEIFDHELLDLFNQPNPFQTRYQFMYLATMYKKLVGEEFWQINFLDNKKPGEMWLVPPAYMAVIPSATDYIDHYEFKRIGMPQPVNFTVEEIIHIMTPNPYNPYRGLSEAQALTVDLDSESYAARYQQKLFFNDATPGFVIKYPAADLPTSEQRKELQQEWDERFRGFRNRGKTAFLWGGEPAAVTLKNTDMDFANLRKFSREVILGAYRVHPSIIGVTESVNLANAEAGQYQFAMYAIEPELAQLREALNKELTVFYGDNLQLDYDNPVPEDETRKVNNVSTLFKAKIITKNEARGELGYDEVEGGDDFMQDPPSPFGNIGGNQSNPIKPEDQNPKPLAEEGKGIDSDPFILFPDENSKEEYWKGYVKRVEAYEAPIIKSLKEIFEKQKEEALNSLKGIVSPGADLINQEKFREEYTKAVKSVLTDLITGSMKAGMELIPPKNPHTRTWPSTGKQDGIPPVVNQHALNWLLTRIGWAADEIGAETAKLLAQQLHDGYAAGESMEQIADRVKQVFEVSDIRANRIARTETIAASNIGAQEGYREAGLTKSEWYTAIDERVCALCDSLHGKVSDISEGFTPPAHPDCLLPDVRVEAAHIVSGSRTFYRGEAVEITTQNGNILTCTPNHPVLTFGGFIKAKGFHEGDYVIRSLDSKRIIASIDPDNNNVPAFIDNIWDSLRMQSGMLTRSMPVAAEDFYGDARFFDGDVDIIHPDSFLLRNIPNTGGAKHIDKDVLNGRGTCFERLACQGSALSFCDSLLSMSGSNVSGADSSHSLFGCHETHRGDIGLATIARVNPSSEQSPADNSPIYSELSRKFQLRFAGLIAPDKIVKIRKFDYSGHVYDLQSLDQLYIANNIVVKNCRCVLLPVID